MQCPFCGDDDSRVTDSRAVGDGIRRRRACQRCSGRFTTYERVQSAGMFVVKKDGRREPFSREKILLGLQKACEKRPLEAEAVNALADAIETRVQDEGSFEIPTGLIGEWAMEALRELDEIAYVRFASVYRAFADLGALREMLDEFDGDSNTKTPREQLPLLNETDLEQLRAAPKRDRTRLIPFRAAARMRSAAGAATD